MISDLSRNNIEISDIAGRILKLSALYSSDKAFLKKCDISNHSLISNLRNGDMKYPGSKYLVNIVKGTGCSANWLLTGRGRMFPGEEEGEEKSRVNSNQLPGEREAKNKKRPSSEALIAEGEQILARLEAIMGAGSGAGEPGGVASGRLPADIRRKLLELLLLDELRRE